MRLPHTRELADVDVAMVGAPFDGGTSYRPGARLGPREVRSQSSLIRTWSYFLKVHPFERLRVVDYGDFDIPPISIERAYEVLERGASEIHAAGVTPVVVGGDHSISLPLMRAAARTHGPLALVQFDSHIDTWDDYFGGRYFHGSPFRRAIEEGLVRKDRFVQVGIRGPMYGEDEFDFHREHGIRVVDIDSVKREGIDWTIDQMREVLEGPVYLSFDIDSVDPAFAPGTGTPEVGGLTSHEAQRLVRGLAGLDIVAADLVEVAPPYDGPGQITSLLAANLLFEMLCVLAVRRNR
jgi:agmatinase